MAIVTSVLTGGVNSHQTTSEEVNAYGTDFVTAGIVGTLGNTSGVSPATGGFAVNAQGTPDTTIAVSAGVAYVTGTPTSQNSQCFRVKNSASANTTISANASGSTKYDWVYIKLDATKLNAPNTAGDDVATIVTSRSSSATTDDGTPPTYGLAIAVVTVANGFSTITNSNIRDIRTQAALNSGTSATASSWTASGYTPGTVTQLGNRSYSCVVSNADLTSFLSTGMRLRLTRTITAPVTCFSLDGSNDFYNKTSPAGMTFTDDFTVSAWIKITSYAASGIVSRYNGTSGWSLELDSSGRVLLIGYNASSANFSQVLSYQSIPLNKWVHIAAELDMSGFTNSATTSYIMLDGVDVVAVVSRGGTNPTALVQAGNLEVGSRNAGTGPFPGKIGDIMIFNAKVTQATIRTYMGQKPIGTETSLISAYSNGSTTDLNANANNLTAQNGATTASDGPYSGGSGGVYEYGIIQKISFSTDTTITVQLPEGYALPTSGGISAMSYASLKVPYGFPAQNGKWWIMAKYKAQTNVTNTAIGQYAGRQLSHPIGDWITTITGLNTIVVGSAGQASQYGLSSATGSFTEDDMISYLTGDVASQTANGSYSLSKYISLSAQTVYYLVNTVSNSAATSNLASSTVPDIIYAVPAHI